MMYQYASLLYPPPGMSTWPAYNPPAITALRLADAPMLGTDLTAAAVRVRLVPAPRTGWCSGPSNVSGPRSCANPQAEAQARQAMARLNGVLAVRGVAARTSLMQLESCPAQYAVHVDLLPGTPLQGFPTELGGVRMRYFTQR